MNKKAIRAHLQNEKNTGGRGATLQVSYFWEYLEFDKIKI